jgi:hypothetical protein
MYIGLYALNNSTFASLEVEVMSYYNFWEERFIIYDSEKVVF